MCSAHLSAACMCLFLSASSLKAKVSLQVGCGMYRPGRMGMKSLIGLPKTHWAGDSFVLGSGVLRYCSMACWNALVSRLPCASVLLVMSRLTVFTPTSALQLECGNATDDRRWCTPHSLRNCCVDLAMNSGPPSVAHSSGMPYVANVRLRQSTRPVEPSRAFSMIGQLEYRSTTTR